ncbi:MAG TPA: hypothetical protein VK623_05585 [Flavobacterium sp.]|nr:hypothetical protein [Flavobacterium sp.]
MFEHPANNYRNYRAKYFAIANKHGFKTAYYILEKDKDQFNMDSRDYAGLLGELIFFEKHIDDMDLNPTLDYGDHCDFRGIFNDGQARFDVTTNLDYKILEDYEPFQKKGKPYYIALIDTSNKKVERIVDINIPFCPKCGGRLINTAIIENIKYTKQGTPTQTERIIKICSNDLSHNQNYESFEYFISSIGDEIEFLYEQYGDFNPGELNKQLLDLPRKHGINNALFFSKKIDDKIHACAQEVYKTTSKDGDGFWETKLFWTTDLVDKTYPNGFGELL